MTASKANYPQKVAPGVIGGEQRKWGCENPGSMGGAGRGRKKSENRRRRMTGALGRDTQKALERH